MYNDFRHLLFGGESLQNIQNFTAIDSKHLNIRRSVLINLMEGVRRQQLFSISYETLASRGGKEEGWTGQEKGVKETLKSKQFYFHPDVVYE